MRLRTFAASCFVLLAAEHARAATFYIDPTVPFPGNGSIASPYKSWAQVSFSPGNSYLQRAGTTATGAFAVEVPATSGSPILIGRYGTGSNPVLVGTVVFRFAAYATIENFEIRDSPSAGVQILTNSEHITVRGLTLYHCATGVSIDADAKGGNLIELNTIFENDGSGVTVLGGQTSSGDTSTIQGNTIYRNGLHGVHTRGNHYIVQNNEIHNNGLSGVPGTSGVHIFSLSPAENSGDFNVVRNNRISHQNDYDGFDGNGIQSDQFCDYNQIYDNVLFQNDGAGVFLFDAQFCTVTGNTLYANMHDPGSTREAFGEISLGTKSTAFDLARNNTVLNNIAVATNPNSVAVFIDSATVNEVNHFGGNGFGRAGAGDLWWTDPNRGADMAVWNAYAAGDGDDYAYDPVSAGFVPPAPPPAYMLDSSFTVRTDAFKTLVPGVSNVYLGSSDDDVITGFNLADTLIGNAGDDVIDGGNGDDWVVGGAGNDTLYGGAGADLVLGGLGDDWMDGGTGDDSVFGGDGNDWILGGDGYDRLSGGNGIDQLRGGDGEDSLTGGADDDVLAGGAGRDSMDGGPGDDRLFGGDGDDSMIGGTGHDFLSGDAGNDQLTGGDGDDILLGGAGDDALFGGAGDDVLDGGLGDDYLDGGTGNDVFLASPGSDQFVGGAGADQYFYGDGTGSDVIIDFEAGTDVFVVAEGVNGTSIQSVADLAGRIADIASGMLVDLGGGNQVLLAGLFTFTVTPSQIFVVADPAAMFQTPRVLSIPETLESAEGSVVTVPVTIDMASGITAVNFQLAYDPDVVRFLGVQGAPLVAAWAAPGVTDLGSAIAFNAAGSVPLQGGGELARLRFQVLPNPKHPFSMLYFEAAELNAASVIVAPADAILIVRGTPALPLDSTVVLLTAMCLAVLGALRARPTR